MSWPGLGQLLYDAVLRRDLFLVVDLAVISAFLTSCSASAYVFAMNPEPMRPTPIMTIPPYHKM